MNKVELIRHSEYVVGAKLGDVIYINPELRRHPKLFEAVLNHELKHSAGIDKNDIVLDIFNEDLSGNKLEYWKFVFTHPKTWVSFLPASRINGKWYLDVALSMFWFIIIAGGSLIWTLR